MSILNILIASLNAFYDVLRSLPGLALFCSFFVSLPGHNEINVNSHNSHATLKVETPSWHKYVRQSSGNLIKPLRVISQYTKGNVSNPSGLINGRKPTILTRTRKSNKPPSIVVDFGLNTVGIVLIDFAGSSNYSSGRPGIRLAFSETLQFLSDVSDFSRSYNVSIYLHKDAHCWPSREIQ